MNYKHIELVLLLCARPSYLKEHRMVHSEFVLEFGGIDKPSVTGLAEPMLGIGCEMEVCATRVNNYPFYCTSDLVFSFIPVTRRIFLEIILVGNPELVHVDSIGDPKARALSDTLGRPFVHHHDLDLDCGQYAGLARMDNGNLEDGRVVLSPRLKSNDSVCDCDARRW